MSRAGGLLDRDVFPRRIYCVSNLDYTVSVANAGLCGRAVWYNVANDRRRIARQLFVVDHVHAGQHRHRQNHVHERSREHYDQSLPSGFGLQTARIGRGLIPRLIARHFDVTAEQDSRKSEVGVALLETEKPWAETDAEGLHSDVEQTRRPIMAQFVNQDHHPDQDQQPPHVLEYRHLDLCSYAAHFRKLDSPASRIGIVTPTPDHHAFGLSHL